MQTIKNKPYDYFGFQRYQMKESWIFKGEFIETENRTQVHWRVDFLCDVNHVKTILELFPFGGHVKPICIICKINSWQNYGHFERNVVATLLE